MSYRDKFRDYIDIDNHFWAWLLYVLGGRLTLLALPFLFGQLVSMHYSMLWTAWATGFAGLVCGQFLEPPWYLDDLPRF